MKRYQTFEVEEYEDRIILKFTPGDLVEDLVVKLVDDIDELIQTELPNLIELDMSQTRYVNSSGVGALITVLTKFRNSNKEFYIINASEHLRKLLVMTKMDNLFLRKEDRFPSNELKSESEQKEDLFHFISYVGSSTVIRSESEEVFLKTDEIASIFSDIIIKSAAQNQSTKTSQEDRFFGIFGQWGRGKTFFWNLIKSQIKKKHPNDFNFIEFHAWKYQDTPSIWAYLYESFADQYYVRNESNWDVLPNLISNTRRSLHLSKYRNREVYVLWWVGLIALIFSTLGISIANFYVPGLSSWIYIVPTIATITSMYAGIKSLVRPLVTKAREFAKTFGKRNSYKSHLGVQHEIQSELVHLLKAWQDLEQKNFILFIDDIDRCDEKKIIHIVDSIRVMLNEPEIQKRLIIIAAIDERILSEAIRGKYRTFIKIDTPSFNLNRISAEYLDKLFIAGIKLDPLSDAQKREIISEMLKDITDFETSDNTIDNSNEEEEVNENILRDQGGEDEETDKTDQTETESEPTVNVKTVLLNTELHQKENELLVEHAKDLMNATPRLIRSYSIKYRLAKSIVSLYLQGAPELLEHWLGEEFKAQEALIKAIIATMNFEAYSQIFDDFPERLAEVLCQVVEMVTYYFVEEEIHKDSTSSTRPHSTD